MAESILVVSSTIKFYNSILPLLKKTGNGEDLHALTVTDAKRILMTSNISAIIINCPLKDEYGLDFATELSSKQNCAVLVFVNSEFLEKAKEKCQQTSVLLLGKPTSAEIISNTLPLLLGLAKKLKSILRESPENKDKTEQLKLQGHAKLILISSFGMSEEQAHKYIEKRAMEFRKTKSEIAKSIITAYGNR